MSAAWRQKATYPGSASRRIPRDAPGRFGDAAIPEGTTFDAQALDTHFKPTKTKARTAEIESILDTFAALGQLIPIGGSERHEFARPMRAIG